MKVFLNVPIFTSNADDLNSRKAEVETWLNDVATPRIAGDYRCKRFYRRILQPGAGFTLRSDAQSADRVTITYPERRGALVPKGRWVRLEIFRALDEVDENDPRDRDNAFFIMIDGSGAFKLENLFALLNRLQATPPAPRSDVVLGIRPEENTGMPTWRRAIELFEESLLFAVLGTAIRTQLSIEVLPDSQAGCWGLCLGAMKRLALTARNYGLEFDLLASALSNQVPMDFVGPLKMGDRTPSTFVIGNSMYKLKFIMHKLSLSSEEILTRLNEYIEGPTKDTGYALPLEYVSAVRSLLEND